LNCVVFDDELVDCVVVDGVIDDWKVVDDDEAVDGVVLDNFVDIVKLFVRDDVEVAWKEDIVDGDKVRVDGEVLIVEPLKLVLFCEDVCI
jgi:hypothetical protein